MANNDNVLFDEKTNQNDDAVLLYSCFERHIHGGPNYKYGWVRPSAFEIRESVRKPSQVIQSKKDPNTHLYVKLVGKVATTQWYTITFLRRTDSMITTAYNSVTFFKKGTKVWP